MLQALDPHIEANKSWSENDQPQFWPGNIATYTIHVHRDPWRGDLSLARRLRFCRLRFPGRQLFFGMTIATMTLPYEVTLIPTYLEYYLLGWPNTYQPLTVPCWPGGGAFFIFLFRQFFMTIPPDLDEAAKIDGAGHVGILFWVVIPLSLPVLAATAILSFINYWSSFVLPLIILNDPPKFTLSIGLGYFQMQPAE